MKNVLVIIGSDDSSTKLYLVSMEDDEYEEVKDAHNWCFEDGYSPTPSSLNSSKYISAAKLISAIDLRSKKACEALAKRNNISEVWCGKFKGRIVEVKDNQLPDSCCVIFCDRHEF